MWTSAAWCCDVATAGSVSSVSVFFPAGSAVTGFVGYISAGFATSEDVAAEDVVPLAACAANRGLLLYRSLFRCWPHSVAGSVADCVVAFEERGLLPIRYRVRGWLHASPGIAVVGFAAVCAERWLLPNRCLFRCCLHSSAGVACSSGRGLMLIRFLLRCWASVAGWRGRSSVESADLGVVWAALVWAVAVEDAGGAVADAFTGWQL